MIHAEDERSFDTALRGMAYPLTDQLLALLEERYARVEVDAG